MISIQLVQKIDLGTLTLVTKSIGRMKIGNRFDARFQQYPLVTGGHKSGTPGARTVYDHRIGILDNDEARQILIQSAQSIGHQDPNRAVPQTPNRYSFGKRHRRD